MLSAMRRSARNLLLLLAACVTVALYATCGRPILRGPDFGPHGEPYRKQGPPEIPPRDEAPVFRIILAGDAGAAVSEDPTLALLGRWGDELPDRTRVVYLGDNVYPAGLQDADRERGEAVLLRQIRATRAPKLFLPGNHDWGHRGTQWLRPGVLENQQAFIEAHADLAADFEPKNGCPGPSEVELLPAGEGLDGGLVLLVLDLHWWLLPETERPSCKGVADTTAFLERFRERLAAHRNGNLIVAAHHPIRSGGPHGGQTRGFWTDLGLSLAYRFYIVQDLFEPGYRDMVRLLEEPMRDHPPLAMVGGHDHGLQVIDGGDVARLVIVSGAASTVSGVTAIEGTLFAHAHLGFVVMDFLRVDGEETLLVHVVQTDRGRDPVFTLAIDLEGEQAAD